MKWLDIATGKEYKGRIPTEVSAPVKGKKPFPRSVMVSAEEGDADYDNVLELYMLYQGYVREDKFGEIEE